MKAVLRVDASARVGLGHLARCLTLARGLCRRGLAAEFVVRAPDEHVRRWIEAEGHRVVALAADEAEIAATERAVEGADLVIVDGYTFGVELHDAVRAAGPMLCVIDDLGTAPVRADVVLNGNVFAEALRYEGVPLRLLGPSFGLVREEFLAARTLRQGSSREHGGVPRVLVTMGGADPAFATEAFLAGLEALERVHVRVVVGGANPRAEAIATAAAAIRGHHVEVIVAAENMAELMAWSDVTVAAAGSTCLELACVGVAAVVVAVADNQVPVAAEVARRGMMVSVGRLEDVPAGGLVAAVRDLLASPATRSGMEITQRAVVDGLGQDRAAAALVAAFAALPHVLPRPPSAPSRRAH